MKKIRRYIQNFVSQPEITKFFSRFVSQVDLISLRLSNGKFSLTSQLTGWKVITLTTLGAKSNLPRTTPLIGIQDGHRIILIASNFGRQRHPAWYYNLKTNPLAIVNIHGTERRYIARETSGEEYNRLWRIALETYSGYELYRQQTQREFPIIILDPLDQ